jgi:DNA-binding XRE family transcriptional regulator
MNISLKITHFTSETGEKMVALSEAEFELIEDALDCAEIDRIQAQVARGECESLTHSEVIEMLDAPTSLAFWRKKRGLTQAKLAERVGVSQAYIADLSNGKRKGDPALFLRLAKALNVQMESLVDYPPTP